MKRELGEQERIVSSKEHEITGLRDKIFELQQSRDELFSEVA